LFLPCAQRYTIHMIYTLLNTPHLLRWLLIISTMLHVMIASTAPLTVDEAHYALYGMNLDWSYFDHPPMVGWLQSLALMLGHNELILRLWPISLYALTLILVYRFSLYQFASQASANLAALLFSIMPMSFVLGAGFVPESILMPLTIALFWQAQRTLNTPSWRNWAFLGLLLGLAGLSKYTAILMAAGLMLMLMVSHQWRWLMHPKLWFSVIIAGAMLTPVIYWNTQHDWISFIYQLNHGAPDISWQAENLAQSQISQLLSYTPLVWFAAWLAMFRLPTLKDNLLNRQLWSFVLPALMLFTISSGKEPSLPHWLLFFYIMWLPIIAYQLVQRITKSRLLGITTLLNSLLGIIMIVSISIFSIYPKWGENLAINPAADLFGWKETAQLAHHLAQPDEPILVASWVDASRIAWYAQPTPVLVLDQRIDQFDLWYGSANMTQSGLFILTPDTSSDWLSTFETCNTLQSTKEGFNLYRCQHWNGKTH